MSDSDQESQKRRLSKIRPHGLGSFAIRVVDPPRIAERRHECPALRSARRKPNALVAQVVPATLVSKSSSLVSATLGRTKQEVFPRGLAQIFPA